MTIRTAKAAGLTVTIDTTGMTFVACFTCTVGARTVTNGQGDTVTALTSRSTSTGMVGQWRYVANPTQNSSYTLSQDQAFSTIFAFATDEIDVSGSPFDLEAGGQNNTAVTSYQPGSVTPSQADSFVLSGIAHSADSNSPTSGYGIDSSFTLAQSQAAVVSSRIGGAFGYIKLTSAAAQNPTFTWTAANPTAGAHAVFKAVASGGGGGGNVPLGILVPDQGIFLARSHGRR
jgi:hypothetical protein